MSTEIDPTEIRARDVSRELASAMVSLEEQYPALVEYLAYASEKIRPDCFFSSRERVHLRLQGFDLNQSYTELPILDRKIQIDNKINSIKWLSQETGWDLKTAKDFVELRARQIGHEW